LPNFKRHWHRAIPRRRILKHNQPSLPSSFEFMALRFSYCHCGTVARLTPWCRCDRGRRGGTADQQTAHTAAPMASAPPFRVTRYACRTALNGHRTVLTVVRFYSSAYSAWQCGYRGPASGVEDNGGLPFLNRRASRPVEFPVSVCWPDG
jgi:hypothetical protein